MTESVADRIEYFLVENVRNELGVAMEYRACVRCGRLRDITTWFDSPDPDYDFPRGMGPLAGARFMEIVNGPRKPLLDTPIPMATDE